MSAIPAGQVVFKYAVNAPNEQYPHQAGRTNRYGMYLMCNIPSAQKMCSMRSWLPYERYPHGAGKYSSMP
ncbi:hypothetical protein J27TS7_50760 [Paenibacillus dendritiformis]|nr:hypothetical protein J27TS7_50760 [Paenibacillus dendritiformis]